MTVMVYEESSKVWREMHRRVCDILKTAEQQGDAIGALGKLELLKREDVESSGDTSRTRRDLESRIL
jgi:hypothetical protein